MGYRGSAVASRVRFCLNHAPTMPLRNRQVVYVSASPHKANSGRSGVLAPVALWWSLLTVCGCCAPACVVTGCARCCSSLVLHRETYHKPNAPSQSAKGVRWISPLLGIAQRGASRSAYISSERTYSLPFPTSFQVPFCAAHCSNRGALLPLGSAL